MPEKLFLASASPRRVAMLGEAGLRPIPRPSGILEIPRPGESPADHVLRLAEEKGLHAVRVLREEDESGVVLAADTAVVLDGEILGKPADAGDALRMLRLLSGRTHRVLTGVFLARFPGGGSARAVVETLVTFRAYDESEARRYVETGEPLDKAGAYGIQGAGAALVLAVSGSYSNVVGLPMEALPALFRKAGASWPAGAARP